MNYKDIYNRALETAKHFIACGHLSQEDAEEMFHELRESEDEKTRKWIIQELKATHDYDSPTSKKEVDDAIAWLEKKKERGFLSKDEEYILARIIEYLEDNDCPEEWKNLLHDIYSLPYQKNEWTKEDKRLLGLCIDAASGYYSPDTKQVIKDWLSNLPERFNLQLNPEWSEEDKKHSAFIVGALDAYYRIREYYHNTDSQQELDEAVEWLHNRFKLLSSRSKQEFIGATQADIDIIATHLDNLGNTAMADILRNIHVKPA